MRKFLAGLLWISSVAVLVVGLSPYVRGTSLRDNAGKVFVRAEDFFLPPCSRPLRYSLGTVDDRFGLSEEDVLGELASAESVWESASGKNLLEYDPQAELKVNFVFDGRQQRTIASQKIENDFESVTSLQAGISKEYDSLSAEYRKKMSEYDDGMEAYRKRSDKYVHDVAYWNEQGNIPEKEYDRLKKEKKKLTGMEDDMEGLRNRINFLVKKINALADKERGAVDEYNQKLTTYRDRYGESSEFDKGVYSENQINIYQFEDGTDLALVLAHELGHAIGMDHVGNPVSIMHYLMGEQDMDRLAPTGEDIAALDAICRKRAKVFDFFSRVL